MIFRLWAHLSGYGELAESFGIVVVVQNVELEHVRKDQRTREAVRGVAQSPQLMRNCVDVAHTAICDCASPLESCEKHF